MQFFQQISDAWFEWILVSSFQIALLVVVLLSLTMMLGRFSPRLHYGIWILVLVKIFLPPGIASRWSLRNWAVEPMRMQLQIPVVSDSGVATAPEQLADMQSHVQSPIPVFTLAELLFLVWIVGVVVFAVAVVLRYRQIAIKIHCEPIIQDGPFRVALESLGIKLGLRHLPLLHVSKNVASPLLLGVFVPRIAIPANLIESLDRQEIEAVLTHELTHMRRWDPFIGWIQLFAQMLFWFHPFVWLANNQIRHHRECVCDEISMLEGNCNPKKYAETIVHILTLTRCRSSIAGGLVGVFGNGSKLQNRMERIMSFELNRNRFGWISRAIICILGILLLPMSAIHSQDDKKTEVSESRPSTPYPQIVETTPKQGAVEVDPNLDKVTVTFDRDMQDGMSWTGGGPLMPADPSRKPKWIDKRTCVLPVKLTKGKVFRVGINAKDYQNFMAADGTPIPPEVIAFATKGASKGMQKNIQAPEIVKISPALNATDVSPKTQMLKVTFNVPMSGGMSWTGGGEDFPAIPEGKRPKWSKDGKSCLMPVELKPNWSYQIGLNSLSHNNFQSKFGIPLKPVVYKFFTTEK